MTWFIWIGFVVLGVDALCARHRGDSVLDTGVIEVINCIYLSNSDRVIVFFASLRFFVVIICRWEMQWRYHQQPCSDHRGCMSRGSDHHRTCRLPHRAQEKPTGLRVSVIGVRLGRESGRGVPGTKIVSCDLLERLASCWRRDNILANGWNWNVSIFCLVFNMT